MFKLASLVVEIVAQSDSLDRALSRTHSNLTTANVALGTFAGNVAASFARMAVGAAGGLFEGTIRSASHLGETMNRVKVVLGDSADKVITDANTMADRYGFVKNEVLGAASSFSLLGKEMKLSEAGSADLGIKLTRMASELTSFFDPSGGLPAMMHKLESGIAGQVKPLRELGIFMTADAVKAEAARMGLKPGASGQLSEADKIKARISFIENSKAMQLATGDLERTLGDTENQTRKFWGTVSNLGTAIGQELNPAWNKLLQSFNTGLDDLKGYFEANKSMVRGWGDAVVEGFNTATIVWRNLPDVLEIALLGADQKMEDARAKIEQWATSVAVYIETAFLKGAQGAGDLFKKAQDFVTTGVMSVAHGFRNIAPGSADYVKAFEDIASESIKAKPTDFTSALIDKANKHLADTLAENTDISSKGIAAAQARITKREADHLTALAEQWVEDTQYDKMFPSATKPGRGKGGDIFGGGSDEEVATGKKKHEKTITDTMSFMANLQAVNLGGDVQDKQLSELQQIRALDQKNADMMEKMLDRKGMAVFG